MSRGRLPAVAVIVVALITVACGGDDDDTAFPPVVVEGTEMKFSPDSFPGLEPGIHTFRLVNKGTVVHELAITDLNDHALVPGVSAPPGGETSLEVKLKKGSYLMVCREPGHLEAGMKAPVEVQ